MLYRGGLHDHQSDVDGLVKRMGEAGDGAMAGRAATAAAAGVCGLLLFTVAGCTAMFGPRLPRTPRGNYSLDQAQQYAERMHSQPVRNQGYRPVKR